MGNCDPGLREKCVRALTLPGHLTESGLPFLFKGGTSILLHLPRIRRLFIDIDIVSPASNEDLERMRRRHFKLWFRSERAPTGEDFVLLDVVQEAHCPHDTVKLPIHAAFLVPNREIPVTLPTIESLLGDKLTAFAPTTICVGVKLRRRDNQPGEIMQVAKQLFDVGVLFEHA